MQKLLFLFIESFSHQAKNYHTFSLFTITFYFVYLPSANKHRVADGYSLCDFEADSLSAIHLTILPSHLCYAKALQHQIFALDKY